MFVQQITLNFLRLKTQEKHDKESILLERHLLELIRNRLNSCNRKMVSLQFIVLNVDRSLAPEQSMINKALIELERKGRITVKDRGPGNIILEVILN